MNDIYQRIGPKSVELYNPTGCWSPTFQASYNDVALVVQHAIKCINTTFIASKPLRNFYLEVEDNGININTLNFEIVL